jgi:ribosomal protein L11 methylase PrmA
LILSGIIQEKLPVVQEHLEKNGFVIEQTLMQNQWIALIVKRSDVDHDGTMSGG